MNLSLFYFSNKSHSIWTGVSFSGDDAGGYDGGDSSWSGGGGCDGGGGGGDCGGGGGDCGGGDSGGGGGSCD